MPFIAFKYLLVPTSGYRRRVRWRDLIELSKSSGWACVSTTTSFASAIVNSKQRCQRLSLVPLCYLWQRDQEQLLAEMIEAGMEAILIKVAGIGLTTKHLGKTLLQMQPTLKRLVKLVLVFPRIILLTWCLEWFIWVTYMRRRWRIWNSNARLFNIQEANTAVRNLPNLETHLCRWSITP